jgi:hypothetical protein
MLISEMQQQFSHEITIFRAYKPLSHENPGLAASESRSNTAFVAFCYYSIWGFAIIKKVE